MVNVNAQNVIVIKTTNTQKNNKTVAGDISVTAAANIQSRARILSPSPLLTYTTTGLTRLTMQISVKQESDINSK